MRTAQRFIRRARRPVRRGTLYLAVLAATMLVAALGLSAILALRNDWRSTSMAIDARSARLHALSGIEMGRWKIAQDSLWRTNNTSGTWYSGNAIGDPSVLPRADGTFSLTVVNPNGSLNHAETDPVVLTATGVKGQTTQIASVTLLAKVTPLTCLATALTTGSAANLGNCQIAAFNQTLTFNGTLSAGSATVDANVECVGTVGLVPGSGGRTSGATARTLPDSHVFDYYQANGTTITTSSIVAKAGSRQISTVVLSPNSNPYGSGTTNSQGIYVIDCGGQSLVIQNCRIVGTLVLLNTTAAVVIQNSVTWEPAVSNYPCLLAKGDLTIKFTNTPLDEGLGKNFNPAGFLPPWTSTPYPWGSSNYDWDTADTYPSQIDGLCYVSGNVTQSGSPTLDALVVGQTLTASGSMTFTPTSRYSGTAPPGFYTVPMVPSPGMWIKVVN